MLPEAALQRSITEAMARPTGRIGREGFEQVAGTFVSAARSLNRPVRAKRIDLLSRVRNA
jgi:hypothetical protein